MSSSAGQQQIVKALGTVVESEPSRLSKQRRNRESCAQMTQVILSKVIRRHREVRANVLFEPGKHGLIQCFNNASTQFGLFLGPIDVATLMRHRRQHVE